MRARPADIIPLLVLAAAYCLLRYPLFYLHGMRQWPLALFVCALAVSCVAARFNCAAVSMLAAIGYVAGFGAGLLFRSYGTDAGGGSTDNLWLIWAAVMACFIVAGVLVSAIRVRRE